MEQSNAWDDYAALYPQIDNELEMPVLLRTALSLVEGGRFIDVGCGEGGLLDVVRAEVGAAWEITGFEISGARGEKARARGHRGRPARRPAARERGRDGAAASGLEVALLLEQGEGRAARA